MRSKISLFFKLVLWNIVALPVSLVLLVLFIKANPDGPLSETILVFIWLGFTVLLATGLGYALSTPKEEQSKAPLEFPEGVNTVRVGPIFWKEKDEE